MRDSIFVIVLFGAMVGGYFSLKKSVHPVLPAAVPLAKPTALKHPQKKVSSRILISKGERKHESANHRSRQQVRHPRPSQAVASQAREDDSSLASLPSIYEGEGSGREFVGESELGTALTTDNDTAKTEVASGKPAVVAGVPVAAWVKANRNRLAGAEITPEESEKVRLYLWCMEVKKGGAQYSGEKKCQDIVMAQSPSRRDTLRHTY